MRHSLLPLVLLAGAISLANPQEHVDLSKVWVEIPPALDALGGDVRIRVLGTPSGGTLRVRLARDDDEGRSQLATLPLVLDTENRLTLPCGYFSRGGTYYLELIDELKDNFLVDYNGSHSDEDTNRVKKHISDSNARAKDEIIVKNYTDKGARNTVEERDSAHEVVTETNKNESENKSNREKRSEDQGSIMETGDSIVKSWRFEVFWPTASLHVTPEQIQTYPEIPVTAILEFPQVLCTPLESSADFWLELLYCGHSSNSAVLCDGRNSSSRAHVLYSEQMYGFPGRRTMTLRCELFGQAGDYALTLRPATAAGPQDLAVAFIKAEWSDQFVLNVHGGSVFPCGDGVRTLFQYPECVLEGADRVRLFGRDGDRLKYVTERRVRRGQHTASFDCQLFSERYPEYCFVYVSQAVTGAVSDVRMDCLPTLPLLDGGAGGWGAWSPWSSCPPPAHCSTRTRSRHRFCDSPPPAYGAHYCEGPAVELAACECAARPWAGDSSVVVAEVGARCRCGCVLHLAPVARLLAGSAKACPSRSFWLLQAEEGLAVRLRIDSVRLPCAGQSLKARDGDSLGAPLLASWDGPDSNAVVEDVQTTAESGGMMEISGGRHILVELRSGDTSDKCAGGFLAHATQFGPTRNASAVWASVSNLHWWRGGGGARGAAVALATAAALAALCLALHSAQRNRAYQRAADKESLTDSDACSASLEMGVAPAGSRSTLLSEVAGGVSLRRLLPSSMTRHTRLQDEERCHDADQREEDDQVDPEHQEADTVSVGAHSSASQATVTPENVSSSSAPAGTHVLTPPPLKARTVSAANISLPSITSPPQVSTSEVTAEDMSTSVTSVSERDDTCSEKDRDSAWEKDRSESRASSSTSAATLTNGWYSPALSGVSAARIRDNPKHTKESCNRRLLRSDLSLSSHPEMEIDYYDYEVNNAGSAPGSYLGMDPAFLVWIPPLEEGEIITEIGDKTPIYEEILPSELQPDPGSNTESPEDLPSSSSLINRSSDNRSIKSNDSRKSRKVVDRSNIIHPLNFSISDLQNSPKNKRKKNSGRDAIPLKELTLTRSPITIPKREREEIYDSTSTLKRVNDTARETMSDSLRSEEYSDIKFADENSDSSCDMKLDDSPDSNRLMAKYGSKT